MSSVNEIAETFLSSGYLSAFDRVLEAARIRGTETVVVPIERFHLLQAAICVAGSPLFASNHDAMRALAERVRDGSATSEDYAAAADYIVDSLPKRGDCPAMTVDGNLVQVTNCTYRGTYAGFRIVTIDYAQGGSMQQLDDDKVVDIAHARAARVLAAL